MFDDAALQIATATRLHGCVNQTFSSGHAVEVVLLRSDSREKAPVNEAACSRTRVVALERGQVVTADHERRSTTLQLDLTEETRDLKTVHLKFAQAA